MTEPKTRPEEGAGGKSRPGRKRRRWLRWGGVSFAAIVLLLVLLGALAPYIISTGPVTRLILKLVNDRIRGRIEVDDLSLGWRGPTVVRGLTITDDQGREVLAARSVTLAGGLWKLITSAQDFGRLEVASPRVELRMKGGGGLSLADAFSSPGPPRAKPRPPRKAKLASPTGTVVLRDAVVGVVLPSGRRYEISGATGEVTVQTLDSLKGDLEARLPEGGAVKMSFALSGMVEGEELRFDKASGSLAVRTEEAITLAPVGRFAGLKDLAGTVALTVSASLDQGRWQGDFDLAAEKLQAGGKKYSNLVPTDLRLAGRAGFADRKISGEEIRLSDLEGGLVASFAYVLGDRPLELSWNDVMDAVFAGRAISLPDFTLNVSGRLGPRIARALPSLLGIRADVSVTGGVLEMNKLSLRGGARPAANGAIVLMGLTGERGGRTISLNPVTFSLDAGIVPGEGLRLADTEVKSDFVQLTAAGTASSRLTVTYNTADLDRLRQELGEIFELGEWDIAGASWGSVAVTRTAERRADLTLNANVKSLLCRFGSRSFDVQAGSFVSRKGYIDWQDTGSVRLASTEYELNMDEDLAVKGASASFDLAAGSFQADVEIVRAVLAAFARKAEGLGYDQLAGYSGMVAGNLSVSRGSADAPLASSGRLDVSDLRRWGEPISRQGVSLEWKDVRFARQLQALSGASAKLTSAEAVAAVTGLRATFGEDFTLDGDVSATADLYRTIDAVAKITRRAGAPEPKKPMELFGELTWRGSARSDAGGVTLAGSGRVDNFQVGSGEDAVKENQVRFEDHAIRIDHRREEVVTRRLGVNSELLTVTVNEGGTIRRYKTEKILDITGHYDGDWKRLTALLHQFVPATVDLVDVAGTTGGDFRITGPANEPKLTPVFRDMSGDTAVGWASANVAGFALGGAKFQPALSDARVKVPVTDISAPGGRIRLGGAVDMREDVPVLELPGNTVILDRLRINPEVGRKLLSRFNPIFGNLVSLEGAITLETTKEIRLPLKGGGKFRGSGSGRLDLTGMRLQPAGLLAELLVFGGIAAGQSQPVEIGSVDFTIENDRIAYEDFTVKFGDQFDMKFYGSVGFDEKLDLTVSIPVRSALLERYGVKGPLLDYARALEGMRVPIPITGTRLKPSYNLPRETVQRLAAKAIETLLKEEAQKRLKDLIKPKGDDKDKPPAPEGKPPATTRPTTPQDILLKGIFDILDDVSKQKDKPKR